MDYSLVASLIIAVLAVICGYIERWLKKQGYDQGDIGYRALIKVAKGLAIAISGKFPELAVELTNAAEKLEMLWNDASASTVEVQTAYVDLVSCLDRAQTSTAAEVE